LCCAAGEVVRGGLDAAQLLLVEVGDRGGEGRVAGGADGGGDLRAQRFPCGSLLASV
jgi:hypothetical protein